MIETIDELNCEIKKCEKCGLCKSRKNVVLGSGNLNSRVMIIGEGPSNDDDQSGEIFTGPSGKLLNFAFQGVGLKREDVYITNVLKCRSEKNEKDDIEQCLNYLRNEVILLKPKIIVLMGNVALRSIFGNDKNISSYRGKWIEKKDIKYMPTYHPAALFRNENLKIEFWNDLKLVVEEIEKANN